LHWHSGSKVRLSPAVAAELARRADAYIVEGQVGLEYEEPVRDMVLAAADGAFGFAEVTGLPWIEIDFPADVRRAAA
jgi:choline kinase